MKINIVTLANKHKEFIEYQYISLKCFISSDFDYTVFNTSQIESIEYYGELGVIKKK